MAYQCGALDPTRSLKISQALFLLLSESNGPFRAERGCTSSGWTSKVCGGLGGWLESSNAFSIIVSMS